MVASPPPLDGSELTSTISASMVELYGRFYGPGGVHLDLEELSDVPAGRRKRRRVDDGIVRNRATDACARADAEEVRELLMRLPDAQRDVITRKLRNDL